MEAMEARTLPGMFFERVRLSSGRRAVMYRVGREWESMSWDDLDVEVRRTARGLSDWVRPGDRVAILSENRPEWWVADLAVLALGGVTVPVYPTHPPPDVAYILRDSRAGTLFVSGPRQLEKIARLRRAGLTPLLKRVVSFDPVQSQGGWLLSFDALRLRNPSAGDVVAERAPAIEPGGLATVIYTSGTTGEPKGVMLSHGNLLSNAEGAHVVLDHIHLPEFLMLSFLPLSHSLERTVGFYVPVRFGITVAFARGIETLLDDLRHVQPTLLVSVPRIYERLYGRVMESARAGVRRRVLARALAVGRAAAELRLAGRPVPRRLALERAVAHRLVFSRILGRLGGRLEYAISGGAPLAPDIAWFLEAVGLTVFEGYGLTESSPILAANRPGAIKVGTVGRPWPGVELRITGDGHGPVDGEILARGPGIMMGYLDKPEETKAALDAEGWLHTGDVGHLDEDGMLRITDRLKELLKTSGGKYVAPGPIENALQVSPLIAQAVVVGDRRPHPAALLVPDFQALADHLGRPVAAVRRGVDADPEARRLYQDVLAGVNAGLGSWEQVRRFALLEQELTQEGGELTPTLKVKRRVIEQKYREVIEALYAGPRPAPPPLARREETRPESRA